MSEKKATKEQLQFISFCIGKYRYGFDIHMVKEVTPNTDISPVPLCDSSIRGLINIRGQTVLAIDTAVIFGQPPQQIGEESRLVILKTASEIQRVRSFRDSIDPARFSDKPVGFLVESIGDVIALEQGAIEPTPPHLAEDHIAFVDGVAGIEGDLLILLDAVEMLASLENAG